MFCVMSEYWIVTIWLLNLAASKCKCILIYRESGMTYQTDEIFFQIKRLTELLKS